jgi:O-antigen/teichoic acid export membrane protein
MMDSRQRIIKGSTLLFGGRALAALCGVVVGVVLARVLGPASFGTYSVIALCASYSGLLNLGLLSAANREVLILRGKGQVDRGDFVQNNAIVASLALALLVSVSLAAGATVVPESGDLRAVLSVLAVLYVLLTALLCFELRAWVEKKFLVIGRARVVEGVLRVVLLIGLALAFGLYGVLVGLVLVQVALLGFMAWQVRLRFFPAWDHGELIRLLKIALAVFFDRVVEHGFRSVAYLIVMALFTRREWGYYGLAFFAVWFLFSLMNESMAVVVPFMQERYGSAGSGRAIAGYVLQPLRIFACVSALITGWVWLGVDVAVARLLPEYAPSAQLVKIMVLNLWFLSVAMVLGAFLFTVNRQNVRLVCRVLALIVNLAAGLLLVQMGYGLESVAVASVLAGGTYAGLLTWVAARLLFEGRREFMSCARSVVGPMMYALAIVGLAELALGSWPQTIVTLAAKGLLFTAFFTPALVRLERETGVFAVVRDVLRTWAGGGRGGPVWER